MNVNWSQFYVGTQAIAPKKELPKKWKAGVEVIPEPVKSDVKLPNYDKVVAYDFGLTPEGDSITFADLKNVPHEENAIYQFSGGKFADEINARIGNKFAADADQREWVVRTKKEAEERNKAGFDGVHFLTHEEIYALNAIEMRYSDDKDNVLNHSFVNDAFDLDKIFDKTAVGYAKYLNHDIQSAYDDEVFWGFEDEEKYRNMVKEKLKSSVSHMLNYFMLGKEKEEDIDRVSGQLADGVIKYAHQVANGDRSLENLDAKVTINGIDIQYRDILHIQNALYELNKQGTNDGLFENNRDFYYSGLGCNYDNTTAFEQLGKKTWEVKKLCKYDLPEEVGNLVLRVYKKRTENLIEQHHVSAMKRWYAEINQTIKAKLERTGNYSNAEFEELKKVYQYKGSIYEKAYNSYAMMKV